MTKRQIEKLLRAKTRRPFLKLESYLLETEADKITADECAGRLNALLGTEITGHNLHNLVHHQREKNGFDFRFQDGRGRKKTHHEAVANQLQETIRQLDPTQRTMLLVMAQNLRNGEKAVDMG